jgi:hypothetical protein
MKAPYGKSSQIGWLSTDPEERRLVPTEPTREMICAGRAELPKEYVGDIDLTLAYRAMLAAASYCKCEKCGKPTQVYGCKYCHECYKTESIPLKYRKSDAKVEE